MHGFGKLSRRRAAAEGGAAPREDDGGHRLSRPSLRGRGRPRGSACATPATSPARRRGSSRRTPVRRQRGGDGRRAGWTSASTASTSSTRTSTTSASGSSTSGSRAVATPDSPPSPSFSASALSNSSIRLSAPNRLRPGGPIRMRWRSGWERRLAASLLAATAAALLASAASVSTSSAAASACARYGDAGPTRSAPTEAEPESAACSTRSAITPASPTCNGDSKLDQGRPAPQRAHGRHRLLRPLLLTARVSSRTGSRASATSAAACCAGPTARTSPGVLAEPRHAASDRRRLDAQPAHRANILNRSFREVGVGFDVGTPGRQRARAGSTPRTSASGSADPRLPGRPRPRAGPVTSPRGRGVNGCT